MTYGYFAGLHYGVSGSEQQGNSILKQQCVL